jgi:hypothetical protein
MTTAIRAARAETARPPTHQLLRGELKKRGGRSPGSRNQVIAGGETHANAIKENSQHLSGYLLSARYTSL